MNANQVGEPLVAYMKSDPQLSSSLPAESGKDSPGYTSVFQDPLIMNKVSEEGIPYAIFQQIQEAGPLTLQEWADILSVSSKTLTRYRKENKVFQPSHSGVILQMTELLSIGIELFGSADKFSRWLSKESFALGGRSPLSLLTNSYGRDLVKRELYATEYGIFA